MPRLVVTISAHGFGHAAQLAPVVNALRRIRSDLEVTIRSQLPVQFLRSRFQGPFDVAAGSNADFGMAMTSAIDVLAEASLEHYALLHRRWHEHIEHEALALQRLRPDLLLSGVGYAPLAAARTRGIAAIGLSSLTWRDIFAHYCGEDPRAARILHEMETAYAASACFIQTEPTLPMLWLPNRHRVGPVTRLGQNRRSELVERLALRPRDRLVLVALGGIASRLPVADWPPLKHIHWIVPADWRVNRADVFAAEALEMEFTDILCSSDAVVTKPGYGTFTEAACNGVPVLYVARHDWPETPYLSAWLHEHGRALEIGRRELQRGDLSDALAALWSQPAKPTPNPSGAEQAATILAQWLAHK